MQQEAMTVTTASTLVEPPATAPEESVALLRLVFLVDFFLSSRSAASTSSFSFSTNLISVSHLLASSCNDNWVVNIISVRLDARCKAEASWVPEGSFQLIGHQLLGGDRKVSPL